MKAALEAGRILYSSNSRCPGGLMEAVFNLVKCCRNEAYDICMMMKQ